MYKHQIRFMDCESVAMSGEPHVKVGHTVVSLASVKRAVQIVQDYRSLIKIRPYSDNDYGLIVIYSENIQLIETELGIHFIVEVETFKNVDLSAIAISLNLNNDYVIGQRGRQYLFDINDIKAIDVFDCYRKYIDGRRVE